MNYLRRCVFDIEVRSPNEFPKPEDAKFPISALTLWDSFTDHYYTLSYHPSCQIEKISKDENWDVYHFNQEILLPINFIKLIRALDPDMFEGFFSRTFDFPYIFSRLINLNLSPNLLSATGYVSYRNGRLQIDGRHVLDIVDMDKKFKKRPSYGLANIATEEQLKVKKIDVDIRTVHDDLSKLDEYNKVDVETTVKLDEKMQHINRYVSRWQFSGLEDIGKAMSNSVVVDTVMLREAKKLGIVLPSKPEFVKEDKENEDDITGGLVFEPNIGVHENVMVFDMSRFYPSIIISLRLSPENISEGGTIIAADGTKYLDNPDAFLPRIVKQFFIERDRIQEILKNVNPDSPDYQKLVDEDENAKFLLNSVFGTFGLRSFRLYDLRIVNSITMSCQKIIKHAKDFIESKGYMVVYGDTDSIFVKVNSNDLEHTVELGISLTNELNKMFSVWALQEFKVEMISLKVSFDKFFSRLIFIPSSSGEPVKKRYAGRLIWTMK